MSRRADALKIIIKSSKKTPELKNLHNECNLFAFIQRPIVFQFIFSRFDNYNVSISLSSSIFRASGWRKLHFCRLTGFRQNRFVCIGLECAHFIAVSFPRCIQHRLLSHQVNSLHPFIPLHVFLRRKSPRKIIVCAKCYLCLSLSTPETNDKRTANVFWAREIALSKIWVANLRRFLWILLRPYS